MSIYLPEGAANNPNAPYNLKPSEAVEWYIDELPTDDEAIMDDLFHLQNRYYSDEAEFDAAVKLITELCGKAPKTKALDDDGYEVSE